MLYPFKFKPVYKNYIWGGRSLANIGKTLPGGEKVAESWEVSAHPNGVSVIANGPLAGMNLEQAVSRFGRKLIGEDLPAKDLRKFPLLVKFIDAADNLSVQVHPDDSYAAAHENGEYGKNEAWLVLDAQPGARLIAGLKKGTTRELFARAIADDSCLDHLNQIAVSAGDVINIPAGLVHAIGKGIIICEVQQNSDTTYRVYDYGRRDNAGNLRPLHIEKALDVINFASKQVNPLVRGVPLSDPLVPNLQRLLLVLNRYLKLEKLIIKGNAVIDADYGRFHVLTVLAGSGKLTSSREIADSARSGEIELAQGESVLLPAEMGSFRLAGNMELLRSGPSIPGRDLQELAKDLCLTGRGQLSPGEIYRHLTGQVAFEPLPNDLLSAGGGD